MADIGDAIKYLYREFILRDLLSFVTPGAIVVGSLLLPWCNLSQIQELPAFLKSIPFVVYIPIFGVFFMAGFAIQCFGVVTHLLKIHFRKDTKEHLKVLKTFLNNTDEEGKRLRERLVILKQMCGNGAIAVFIASISLSIKLWKPTFSPWSSGVIAGLLIIFLYCGHRFHVRQMGYWEDLSVGQTNVPPNCPEGKTALTKEI